MTITANGKTYEVTEKGIKTIDREIAASRISSELNKQEIDYCKRENIDPSVLRSYADATANGERYRNIMLPAAVAAEYDRHIKAAIDKKREKEENSIRVWLSSCGWGDYSPVTVTIDRRDSPTEWLSAAREAFIDEHDVDHPNQSDKDLMDKIMQEVSKFDEKKDRIRKEDDRIEELKALAASTGEKQLLRSYMADCNDPKEECSTDFVSVYVMPDGSTSCSRQHTW